MSESVGQFPADWKKLKFSNGKAASSVKLSNNSYSQLLRALGEVIQESFTTLYGKSQTDTKALKIVDLIVKRFGDIFEQQIQEFVDEDYSNDKISEAVEKFENELSAITTQNYDISTISNLLVDKLSQKIRKSYDKKFNKLIADLNKQFNKKKKGKEKKNIAAIIQAPAISAVVSMTSKILEKRELAKSKAQIKKCIDQFNKDSKYIVKAINENTILFQKKFKRQIKKIKTNVSVSMRRTSRSTEAMQLVQMRLERLSTTKKEKQLLKKVDYLLENLPIYLENCIKNVYYVIDHLFELFLNLSLTKNKRNFIAFMEKVVSLLIPFMISQLFVLIFSSLFVLKDALQPLIDKVMSVKDEIVGYAMTAYKEVIKPLFDYIKDVIGPIVKTLWEGIKDHFKIVIDVLIENKNELFDMILDLGSVLIETLALFFGGIIVEVFLSKLVSFVKTILEVMKNLFLGFAAASPQIWNQFTKIFNAMRFIWEELTKGFKPFVKVIAIGFKYIMYVFNDLLDKFLKGYNAYMEKNAAITIQYAASIQTLKNSFTIIKNAYEGIIQSIHNNTEAFNEGIQQHAQDLQKVQMKYLKTTAAIDEKYGNAIKDGGKSIGKLQEKVIEGILKLVGMGDGSVQSIINKAFMQKVVDFFLFWRESKIPTVDELTSAAKSLKEKVQKCLDKLHENMNDFKIKRYEYDDLNLTFEQWLTWLENRTKTFFDTMNKYVFNRLGILPKSLVGKLEEFLKVDLQIGIVSVIIEFNREVQEKISSVSSILDAIFSIKSMESIEEVSPKSMKKKFEMVFDQLRNPSIDYSNQNLKGIGNQSTTMDTNVSGVVDSQKYTFKKLKEEIMNSLDIILEASNELISMQQNAKNSIIAKMKEDKTQAAPLFVDYMRDQNPALAES